MIRRSFFKAMAAGVAGLFGYKAQARGFDLERLVTDMQRDQAEYREIFARSATVSYTAFQSTVMFEGYRILGHNFKHHSEGPYTRPTDEEVLKRYNAAIAASDVIPFRPAIYPRTMIRGWCELLLGPAEDVKNFYQKYGNPVTRHSLTVHDPKHPEGSYTFTDFLLVAVGGSTECNKIGGDEAGEPRPMMVIQGFEFVARAIDPAPAKA